ncbi:MAG: PIG-L family deacetylase [Actinomycetota bacterium]|nr:PIG-L family deacetylase [Actinomycetota bacterium]
MPGLLALHAHPDDESLSMGGSLHRYVQAGEQVVVVIATGGEVGEVHNYDDPEPIQARLKEVRSEELKDAMEILAVEHVENLGYRDSGMMGTEDNRHPNAFWAAGFDEAVGRLVSLIRRYRPEVVTAYDPFGGYGHPDHIQVHRVGTAAFFGAADTGRFPIQEGEGAWIPQKLYWCTWPRSRILMVRRLLAQAGEVPEEELEQEPRSGALEHDVTAWIDIGPWVELKWKAVLAHVSQIPQDWWLRRVPLDQHLEVFGREAFIRAYSRVEAPSQEDDLFAGLR